MSDGLPSPFISVFNKSLPLMSDPFFPVPEFQGELTAMAVHLTHARFVRINVPGGWRPALNAFRCYDHFTVCVELAGVDRNEIDLQAERRRLVIRGRRALPEPTCDDPPALQVYALEIDHGVFERVLDLTVDIDPARVTAEHRNGLLWIKLPLAKAK